MSKAFAFKLGQRVNVPGKKSIQGVVSLPTFAGMIGNTGLLACQDGESIYFVHWLDEGGNREAAWVGELALLDAQEPEPELSSSPARKSKSKKRK